jgi:hypothetical protein
LFDIDDRNPALKEIHRKDIQHEQQKYAYDNDIVDEFEKCLFYKYIDGDQSEDQETDKEIADEISQIMRYRFR